MSGNIAENKILSGHLSRDTTFSIWVSGEFTRKECERLIEQLNLIRGFFIEDDAKQESKSQ